MNDVLKVGKVSSVDIKNAMIKVYFEDEESTSDWMPCVNNGKEYSLPRIGEGILVGKLSTGDEIAIGTYWNIVNTPMESGNIYLKQLSKENGEAYIKYDETTKELTIKADKVTIIQEGSE